MISLTTIGYVRCSTVEQASDGFSVEAQTSRIRAWCEASGVDLTDVVADVGVSGTKALTDRPGGARIAELMASRRPSVDAVVIVRLDRLGRNAAETLQHLRRFSSGPLGLFSITDRVDLTTPQGRAMAQVSAVFAELERALIGQRTSEALSLLRSDGRPYGPTPFGYSSEGGRLVPISREQSVLAELVSARSAGASYQALADMLNTRGITAKRGGRWHAMSVRSVLRTSELQVTR